jgi:predicted amidophosphoribosyltransferase
MMSRFAKPLLLLLCALFLFSSCASSNKAAKEWKSGDTVICPHCGREFPIPEKLGK